MVFKVLFVLNIPSPYQLDFLSELTRDDRFKVEALFLSSNEWDRMFDVPEPGSLPYKFTILKSIAVGRKDLHWACGVRRKIADANPNLIIVGGSYLSPFAVAMRLGVISRCKWVFWGENPNKRNHGKVIFRAKELFLRWFLRCNAVMAVGKMAAVEYEQFYPGPISNIPYAPNLRRLVDPPLELTALRDSTVIQLMEMAGIAERPQIVLFCGSLIPRKGPDILLEAFALAKVPSNTLLLFVGNGSMYSDLKEKAGQFGLSKRIFFLGFLRQDFLRAAYLASSVFVLPSCTHEGWGVVVQEAMAAELPVVVSDVVGSRWDLVVEGETGFVFKSGSSTHLSSILEKLLSNSEMRLAIGRNARSHVGLYGANTISCKFIDFALSNRLVPNEEEI